MFTGIVLGLTAFFGPLLLGVLLFLLTMGVKR